MEMMMAMVIVMLALCRWSRPGTKRDGWICIADQSLEVDEVVL